MMHKVCLLTALLAAAAQGVPTYAVHGYNGGYGPAGYGGYAPSGYAGGYGAGALGSAIYGGAYSPIAAPLVEAGPYGPVGHAGLPVHALPAPGPVKFLPPVVHAAIPVNHAPYGAQYGPSIAAPYGAAYGAPYGAPGPLLHAPAPLLHAPLPEPVPVAPIGHPVPIAEPVLAPIAPVAKYGIGPVPEYAPKSVSAAVVSTRHVGFREFINQGPVNDPTNVFIDAPVNPVNLVYRSLSSPVSVQNLHLGNAGTFKQTASVDEPHHYVHQVTKPIIQELHEIIAPVRKVKQEVLPVQEEVKTLIAKSVGHKGHPGLALHAVAPTQLLHAPGPAFSGPLVLGNAPIIKKGPLLPLGPAHHLAGPIGLAEPLIEDNYEENYGAYSKNAAVFVPKGTYYKKRAAKK